MPRQIAFTLSHTPSSEPQPFLVILCFRTSPCMASIIDLHMGHSSFFMTCLSFCDRWTSTPTLSGMSLSSS